MEYFSSITSMRLANILTLLLLITLSSTSLPSQTAAIDLGVFDSVLNIFSSPELKELYDSVKKKAPELRSSVKEVFDSVRKKAPELRSSVKEVYDSVKQKAPELSSSVKEMYDSVKKNSPELSSSVKELFDLVKENARDLRSGKASGLSSVVRDIANHYLPDGQARFVAECAALAAEEVFFKVINTVPGGVTIHKILSQTLQVSESDVHREEIKELRDRISRLEKQDSGCTCKSRNLHDQMETQMAEQCRT